MPDLKDDDVDDVISDLRGEEAPKPKPRRPRGPLKARDAEKDVPDPELLAQGNATSGLPSQVEGGDNLPAQVGFE